MIYLLPFLCCTYHIVLFRGQKSIMTPNVLYLQKDQSDKIRARVAWLVRRSSKSIGQSVSRSVSQSIVPLSERQRWA